MRRPDATPTIAEGFHHEEAAGSPPRFLQSFVIASLVAVALQTGLQRQRCYGKTTKTSIAYGKISGQSKFPGIPGGRARSSRSWILMDRVSGNCCHGHHRKILVDRSDVVRCERRGGGSTAGPHRSPHWLRYPDTRRESGLPQR